jgi:hypothetical protein
MQTRAKRNSALRLALCALIAPSATLWAAPGAPQLPNGPGAAANSPAASAPPAAPAPANTNPVPVTPSNNITEVDSSTSSALDYLFNHKAGEGTTMKAGNEVAGAIADKIKAIDVLKTPGLANPAIRGRFETYLGLAEVPQVRIDEYFGKMAKISEMLKAGPSQDVFGAWKVLYSLSEYQDLDAGISKELASRVENFWNTGRAKSGLEVANNKLRNDVETANHNADLDAEDLASEDALSKFGAKQQKGNANNNPSSQNTTNSPLMNVNADPTAAEAALTPTMGANLLGKMEMGEEYLNSLEARAKIKLNEIRENKMSDQDRMDFSDYIRTLYKGHRYYHVILAADFYRALFNEGDYPADLGNQAVEAATTNGRQAAAGGRQISQTMGLNGNGAIGALNQANALLAANPLGGPQADSDQPLSIADEVTSALEINNRVSQAVSVFRYKAEKGEIANASEQLQDAFIANEFHPALQGLPRDDKEKVGEYLTKLDVLKNQLEVRDFEQVESQVAAIQKIATDFDPTEPLAVVNGIKLESRLRLGKARLLAQGGQLNDAMQEFQVAAEEWPGNPDLNNSANTFFKTENTANQATTDFDRMVTEQNFRGIFDRQLEYALAVKGDTTREQQLKDALEKVGKAKMAEEKANMLIMNNDVDGAWETIALATKDWPDDMKLNKMLADLSGRSADFVSALNKAQNAEAKKELGFSLTWFVNAYNDYPASQMAKDGIDRVSKQILSPASATE